MSIWIVTTGNSDVQLKHDRNWGRLYDEVRDDLDCDRFASISRIDPDDEESSNYTAPARVLGLAYGNQIDDDYQDLDFPLLNTFYQYFEQNTLKLEKIVVILTDQIGIFPEEQRIYEKCAYWQDTVTLKPIFEEYFWRKFKIKPDFEYLTPISGQGLDHWNQTLKLVEILFQNIDYDPLKTKTVYVSHQAGTPAISSAVQFISLSKFKKVKFIVSNQYYDADYNHQSEPEEIESSGYWRGIQIQKAKQLVIDGFPGAALKILEGLERINQEVISELEELVNFFNLHSPNTDSSKDFEIPIATQRIVDTLDLIGFCFKQENYLQGITLLAGAQETFLKTAICHEISKINEEYRNVKASSLVKWTNAGLFLIDDAALVKTLNLTPSDDLNTAKKEVLKQVKFPTEDKELRVTKTNGDVNFKTNNNQGLLKWLRNLRTDFQPWPQLKWSCDPKREHESDLRNQLMHNLRGMEDKEVISYLLGHPDTITINEVKEAYNNRIKQQFLNAIRLFNLPYNRENLYKKLQCLADSLM